MELKQGYKHSEVGVIPETWDVKTLGELTILLTNGFVGTATTHYTKADDGITYIQGFNVEENSFNLTGIKKVTREFHERNSKSHLREGDLLTIQTGDVGLTTIVSKEFEGANCHALIISRFKKEKVYPKFFSHYFNSYLCRQRLKNIETGTTMKHLNVTDMLKLQLPLPHFFEQRAIAAALSDVDALLAGLDALIAKKRLVKQGAMQELLTGKRHLPGFGDGWEVRKLRELGKSLRGVSYKGDTDLSPTDTNKTTRLLRSNNVQSANVIIEDLQFVNSQRVSDHQIMRENDILICMANGSKDLVGKAATFHVRDHHKYTFGTFMGCFRLNSDDALPSYVAHTFQTNQYRNYIANLIAGSSINNLKPSDIESIEIPFPQKTEQQAIAEVLSDMDAEISALEQRREKTRLLKQGMMQELLTGRIRLI